MHARDYREEELGPVNLDPKKTKFTGTLAVMGTILLAAFYAGSYVSKLVAKVDDTAAVAAGHTAQLQLINSKIDSSISSQNERARWQSSSLRAIAKKLGADVYPLPPSQDEQPK